MISLDPDCQDQDEMNVGQPISSVSCKQAMRTAFDDCNNGGHGGTVKGSTANGGCLKYSFSAVNQNDGSSCGLPFS
ncbi:hypothetical protein GGR54DRAFT_599002 [Hypoxylon sp. NC1633]|nr:hypothetical protein GGR54DRAFT_599002 [Hypoxylon sp. NC1633]